MLSKMLGDGGQAVGRYTEHVQVQALLLPVTIALFECTGARYPYFGRRVRHVSIVYCKVRRGNVVRKPRAQGVQGGHMVFISCRFGNELESMECLWPDVSGLTGRVSSAWRSSTCRVCTDVLLESAV
jgi:hypothetical protein